MSDETDLPIFSRRLKQLRDEAGLTQQALATAAGLSMSGVMQMEQGKRPDPRLSTVRALAKALGTDLNTLGGLEPSATAKGKGKGKRKEG